MKIKKFKNLWTMGLIIFGVILTAFYIIKMAFPQLVIGVAEIPAVVKFGEYVDSHMWAYYLFNFIFSYTCGYFYCCACCRKPRLSWKDNLILFAEVTLLFLVLKFIPQYYTPIDILAMLLMPTIMCMLDKKSEIKYFYSTVICLAVHILAQIFSATIRDISKLVSYPNTATFTILLIDGFIWLVLLYNYFNYKECK